MSLESRQGWKTAGNGYFIYKASTNFNATQRLEIAGKFSTKPNSQLNNVLVAGEDSSGTLLFQYSVFQGECIFERFFCDMDCFCNSYA